MGFHATYTNIRYSLTILSSTFHRWQAGQGFFAVFLHCDNVITRRHTQYFGLLHWVSYLKHSPLATPCPRCPSESSGLCCAHACREKAIEGVDYVLHTASPFFTSQNEDELVKPAVEGTLNVLRACSAPGSKVGLIAHECTAELVV